MLVWQQHGRGGEQGHAGLRSHWDRSPVTKTEKWYDLHMEIGTELSSLGIGRSDGSTEMLSPTHLLVPRPSLKCLDTRTR